MVKSMLSSLQRLQVRILITDQIFDTVKFKAIHECRNPTLNASFDTFKLIILIGTAMFAKNLQKYVFK